MVQKIYQETRNRDVLFEFHVKFWKLEVYYNVVRVLSGLTAQQKGTTARHINYTKTRHSQFLKKLQNCKTDTC